MTARGSAVDEIAFPRARRRGAQVARISGGRKIQRPGRGHVVDRLCDHATIRIAGRGLTILERRLDEIKHVVDDDVAAGRP